MKNPVRPVRQNLITATVRVKPKDPDNDEKEMEYEYSMPQYEELEKWLDKHVKKWELTGNAYSMKATRAAILAFKQLAEKVTRKKQYIEWNYWIDNYT